MKAITLLSGGLDSTVVLALALQNKRECLALSFSYGQRHKIELEAAKKIAAYYNVKHLILQIDPLAFGQSALVINSLETPLEVPKNRTLEEMKKAPTPPTYVPARNTIFLSFALAQAEMFNASEIHLGVNALDIKYPDCSKAFINAFQQVINTATKKAIEDKPTKLIAPLLEMDKKEIIRLGISLNAPLNLTFSCYSPIDDKACRSCDACILRNSAWEEVREKSKN